MRRLCLLLLWLANPAFAETDIRGLLVEVARASNCVITEEIAETTFPQFGLTQDDVGAVVDEMISDGEGEIVDSEFHLSSELCTGEASAPDVPVVPPVSPLMGRVIEVFHAHGCTMTETEGMPALLAAGLTEDNLASLSDESDALTEAGLMIRDETTYSITFIEPLCSAAKIATDPAEPLIRMLRDHGCRLSQDKAADQAADYGISMDRAHDMAESLMNRGLALEQGQDLVLLACDD